jgi:Ca2+/H+ antiporter
MTKLIAALIIALVLFCGWRLFLYWDTVQHEQEMKQKEEAATEITSDNQLRGLPYQLEASLRAAKTQGVTGLGNWLKAYGNFVQDPRKAWLQLDYCEMLSRQNVAEARHIFEEVKGRTKPDSPVYKRVLKLQKTYE